MKSLALRSSSIKIAEKARRAKIKQALTRAPYNYTVLKMRRIPGDGLRVYRLPKFYGAEYVDLSSNTIEHLLGIAAKELPKRSATKRRKKSFLTKTLVKLMNKQRRTK